jgi:translation elongation factor EF-4
MDYEILEYRTSKLVKLDFLLKGEPCDALALIVPECEAVERGRAITAKLKEVIPNMAETDMSKFKIEQGKLIYIGNDTNEERWTKEVRI